MRPLKDGFDHPVIRNISMRKKIEEHGFNYDKMTKAQAVMYYLILSSLLMYNVPVHGYEKLLK